MSCRVSHIAQLTYRKKKVAPARGERAGNRAEDRMPLLPTARQGAYDVTPQPWYHADMSKKEAGFLLSAARKDGAFVISDDSDGHLLSLYCSGRVRAWP